MLSWCTFSGFFSLIFLKTIIKTKNKNWNYKIGVCHIQTFQKLAWIRELEHFGECTQIWYTKLISLKHEWAWCARFKAGAQFLRKRTDPTLAAANKIIFHLISLLLYSNSSDSAVTLILQTEVTRDKKWLTPTFQAIPFGSKFHF